MEPSKVFTDIVNGSVNVEFLNQLSMVKKAHHNKMAANEIINTVLKDGVYEVKPLLRTQILNWIKNNPWKSGLAGGAALGTGVVTAGTINKRMDQEQKSLKNDPVVKALSNPLNMNTAQKINTGIGAGVGLAGTAGLYGLLGQIPGIKRKPLIKAILAMTGGAALGYAGWRAADNYQKA